MRWYEERQDFFNSNGFKPSETNWDDGHPNRTYGDCVVFQAHNLKTRCVPCNEGYYGLACQFAYAVNGKLKGS